MDYEDILSHFPDATPSGKGHAAKCPAHEDGSASLSLSKGTDGRTLIKCFASCETTNILEVVGLKLKDLFAENKAGKPTGKDWKVEAAKYARNRRPHNDKALADALALPVAALAAIPDLGFYGSMKRNKKPEGRCWTWPEFDGRKNVVGVAKRFDNGKERFKGAKCGLSLCHGWKALPGPVFVVEGMSDTLALIYAGVRAVGRPSNTGGAEHLADLFSDASFAQVPIFVVGENDRKPGGSWPGKTGAEKIAGELTKRLRREVPMTFPPDDAKDVRDWFKARCQPTDPREVWTQAGTELAAKLIEGARTLDPMKRMTNDSTAAEERLREVKQMRLSAATLRGRPRIELSGEGVTEEPEYLINAQTSELVATDGNIYRFGGRLCRVAADSERDIATIKALDKAYLRDWLSERAEFYNIKETKEGPVEVPCEAPRYTFDFLLSPATDVNARPLSGVMNFPFLAPNGRIVTKEGYDSETSAYLDWQDAPLDLPERPTQADAVAARDRLLEVVADFPFASNSDVFRASWLAGLLTPLARPAFGGCLPLFLIDANSKGTGKTMLADIISAIVTGKALPRAGYDPDPYQSRQMITGVLMRGDRLTLIDNIGNDIRFGNDAYDRLLTATEWQERILGSQNTFVGPNLTVWYATGNQVRLKGDMGRRICYCRLESRVERPEEREGFKRPDLLGWVKSNRLELLRDALTILLAYEVAGRPKAKLKAWGTYEEWSDIVRQAIVWTGFADPQGSSEALRENTDSEGDERGRLLIALAGLGMDVPQGMTVADLFAKVFGALPESGEHSATVRDYFAPHFHDGKPTGKPLAYQFRSMKRRVYGNLFLAPVAKSNRWRVQPDSEWDSRQGESSPSSPLSPVSEIGKGSDGNEWELCYDAGPGIAGIAGMNPIPGNFESPYIPDAEAF